MTLDDVSMAKATSSCNLKDSTAEPAWLGVIPDAIVNEVFWESTGIFGETYDEYMTLVANIALALEPVDRLDWEAIKEYVDISYDIQRWRELKREAMVDAEATGVREFVVRALGREAKEAKSEEIQDEIEERAEQLVWCWQIRREPDVTRVRDMLASAGNPIGLLRARGVVRQFATLERFEKTVASLERRREATIRNLVVRRAAGAWVTPNWARSTERPALRLRAAGR
jgi:hypothetical protein